MNQTGFRFPDNPNDPTGRHCSHPARKYAWICRERAPAINIGEIEERKGHSARLIIFSIAEEERFSRGRLAEVSAVVKNRKRKGGCSYSVFRFVSPQNYIFVRKKQSCNLSWHDSILVLKILKIGCHTCSFKFLIWIPIGEPYIPETKREETY